MGIGEEWRGMEPELLGAGNGRQVPITIKSGGSGLYVRTDRRRSLTRVTDTGRTGMGRSPGMYPCYA
eukprot:scaffold157815_cov75-Attheya_sp.AAC.1